MNLKKKMLLILLPIVLTSLLLANQSTPNKKNLDNELGLDYTKTYKGSEVKLIVDIILEECDLSIEDAYNEGYKQAAIEFQPKLEYYKKLSKPVSTGKKIKQALILGGIGFIAGGTTILLIK